MSNEKFLEKYEELLNKDYCNCNEMNCIDNNSPRRILNIAKKQKEVLDKIKKELEEPDIYGVDEDGYDDAYYDKIYVRRIEELLEEIK